MNFIHSLRAFWWVLVVGMILSVPVYSQVLFEDEFDDGDPKTVTYIDSISGEEVTKTMYSAGVRGRGALVFAEADGKLVFSTSDIFDAYVVATSLPEFNFYNDALGSGDPNFERVFEFNGIEFTANDIPANRSVVFSVGADPRDGMLFGPRIDLRIRGDGFVQVFRIKSNGDRSNVNKGLLWLPQIPAQVVITMDNTNYKAKFVFEGEESSPYLTLGTLEVEGPHQFTAQEWKKFFTDPGDTFFGIKMKAAVSSVVKQPTLKLESIVVTDGNP